MRTHLLFILLFLCLLSGHGALAQAGADANLVSNAGFEEGQSPWQLDNWMKNEVLCELDKKNAHSGRWCMKVAMTRVINEPTVSLVFPHLPLRPQTAVQVRFWARGISNGANLTLMLRRESEPRIYYLRTEMYLTDGWQEYAYTVRMSSDVLPFVTSLRFMLRQQGVFWVDDVSIQELPSQDNGPTPQVNPIRNPSFEVGRDGWTATFRKREFGILSQESGNSIPAPDNASLATATDAGQGGTAPAGQRFLRVTIDSACKAVLTSAYFHARYGHAGHLSFFLRASKPGTFQAGIGSGVNNGSSADMQSAIATAQWQRYSLPFELKPARDGVYFVTLRFDTPGVYDLDGISYTEDEYNTVDQYPPSIAIEPDAHGPIDHLYDRNEKALFRVLVASEATNFSRNYRVAIVDYFERKVTESTITIKGNDKGAGELSIPVPTGSYGTYRIEARTENGKELLAEQIYSVLPSIPSPAERPDSYFGGHAGLSTYNLGIARKAGFRWLRMWPPLLTTWIAGQSKPGEWNFPVEAVARATREGFQLTGILGTTPDFAADIPAKAPVGNRWSHSYPPAKISDWKEYVDRCTKAFAPYINHWEVWNEPDGGFLQVRATDNKATIYLSLLKAAREVLDTNHSKAFLFGPTLASLGAPLGQELLKQGAGQWLDAFSFHFYSLAAGGSSPDNAFVLSVLEKIRKYKNKNGEPMPLWHSEGGMYLQGARSWLATYRIPASSPAKKQQAAASMVRAALLFKALAVKRYFDFQLCATAAGNEINKDETAGFIEVTGIPGPGIAAHAAMVALTEDAAPAGFEEQTHQASHVKIAHFKKEQQTIDVYWSDKPVAMKQLLKLLPNDQLLDMMGNPVSPDTSQTGEFPLYVIRNVQATAMSKHIDLGKNEWQFRKASDQEWLKATIPGTVHTDLLNNKKIPDPFYRNNEKELQWIDRCDWEYRTHFSVDASLLLEDRVELNFEGLDTYADVFLNEVKILGAGNMFRSWKVNVKEQLQAGNNDLRIYFHSPINKTLPLYERLGYTVPVSNNDQAEKRLSVFTRKAGFHYGWDWGPRFVTSGVWRPVTLRAWSQSDITEMYIRQKNIDTEKAQLVAEAEVNSIDEGVKIIEIAIEGQTLPLVKKEILLYKGVNHLRLSFVIDHPQLWWPNGMGKQFLYRFALRLTNKTGQMIAERSVRCGLREVELVQESDEKGRSFYFKVNGRPVFMKGANYIPQDNFLPSITQERFEHIVSSAAMANMNMLRVWGGGIYQDKAFYDLCDEKGILVWQDFMFACALWPPLEDLKQNIYEEAIENIKRLRNHPCIALWCGNNEVVQFFRSGFWGQVTTSWRTSEDPVTLLNTYKEIFHKILPAALKACEDDRPYWSSSPAADNFSMEFMPGRATGDMHYWGVWGGKDPIEAYNENLPRFMSEYGFQSFPDMITIAKFAEREDHSLQSAVIAGHQRSNRGNAGILEYMKEWFIIPAAFDRFIYVAQLLQAEAIRVAIEAHRRAKPYCMGSLYWQLDDCWPGASWSSIDYYGRWKALHYQARRSFESLLLSSITHGDSIHIHLVSDSMENVEAELELRLVDFDGHVQKKIIQPISIMANDSKTILRLNKKEWLAGMDSRKMVLETVLRRDTKQLAQNYYYFEKPKALVLSAARIQYDITKQGDVYQLSLQSKTLARWVRIIIGNENIIFSDNYFDMLPGKPYTVTFWSELSPEEIKKQLQITNLNDAMNN